MILEQSFPGRSSYRSRGQQQMDTPDGEEIFISTQIHRECGVIS